MEVLPKWKEVTDLFRNATKYRTTHASHSARMTVYGREEIKEKLESWAQWVSCWMYGIPPSVSFPDSMPVPETSNGPRHLYICLGEMFTNQYIPH